MAFFWRSLLWVWSRMVKLGSMPVSSGYFRRSWVAKVWMVEILARWRVVRRRSRRSLG